MVAKQLKMQGLGNNFVVLQGPLELTSDQVRKYCSGENGKKTDGLLVVTPIDDKCIRMQYWNADGSVAEMCGNGLRCVARFAVDKHLISPGRFVVNTDAGKLKVIWDGKDPSQIEVQVGKVKVDEKPVVLEGLTFYTANVGNPHAITFVENVEDAPVTTLGPKIETNKYFPNKTNVEFVQVVSDKKMKLRVWERGVGETKACGTGMVSAAVVAHTLGRIQFPIEIEVPGGKAKIWVDEEGFSRILGPAEYED